MFEGAMFFRIVLSILLFFSSLNQVDGLLAQEDSLTIQEIIVDGTSLRYFEPGSYYHSQDSILKVAFSTLPISDLLSNQSGVYIKSYGYGGLATSSLRGAGASQTAVVWDGIPLQSPMLGLIDLSRIPTSSTDLVSVNYGGSGASWGSGAIGGVITLNSRIPTVNGIHGNYLSSFGSWGFRNHQGTIQVQHKKISSVTRLFSTEANNDFPTPSGVNKNAHFAQRGYLQQLYYSPNNSHRVSFNIWLQDENRQIPPTSVQAQSLASQKDNAARFSLHWRWAGQSQVVQFRTGYFSEFIDYSDGQILLNARSNFSTIHTEFELSKFFSKQLHWQVNIINSGRKAKADGYEENISENIFSVFSGLRWNTKRLITQLNLRKEWQDEMTIPIVPSLGFNYTISKSMAGRLKFSRYYRLPTLNDRFWQPGGNVNLIPESGWGQEAGVTFKAANNWTWTSNIYHRLINNWILWSVREGSSIWSSNNIAAVRSYGLEQRLGYTFLLSSFKLNVQLSYDLSHSINIIPITKPRIAAGEQLLYVPVHQGSVIVGFSKGKLNGVYRHRITGEVKGINDSVSAFHLGWLRFDYGIDYKVGKTMPFLQIFIQSDNLWNNEYRVIERRFMPGRSFQFGISFNI
jgi:iron complex outermembrane receptor protein